MCSAGRAGPRQRRGIGRPRGLGGQRGAGFIYFRFEGPFSTAERFEYPMHSAHSVHSEPAGSAQFHILGILEPRQPLPGAGPMSLTCSHTTRDSR